MTFTSETLGIFYHGIPILIGLTCLIQFTYFAFVLRHRFVAIAIFLWCCFVGFVSFNYTLVSGFRWDLSKDLPGVALGVVLFAMPLVSFYIAFHRSTLLKKLFLHDIPGTTRLVLLLTTKQLNNISYYTSKDIHVEKYV